MLFLLVLLLPSDHKLYGCAPYKSFAYKLKDTFQNPTLSLSLSLSLARSQLFPSFTFLYIFPLTMTAPLTHTHTHASTMFFNFVLHTQNGSSNHVNQQSQQDTSPSLRERERKKIICSSLLFTIQRVVVVVGGWMKKEIFSGLILHAILFAKRLGSRV